MTDHKSDCATHNAPAFEPGPCDCQGLEAVARALYEHNKMLKEKVAPDFPLPPYEHDTNGFYTGHARAAMAAMLDHMMAPSEETMKAAWLFSEKWQGGNQQRLDPADAWDAMLLQYRKENLDE